MTPTACAKCGFMPKSIRDLVNSAWDPIDVWRCNNLVKCKARQERAAAKAQKAGAQ